MYMFGYTTRRSSNQDIETDFDSHVVNFASMARAGSIGQVALHHMSFSYRLLINGVVSLDQTPELDLGNHGSTSRRYLARVLLISSHSSLVSGTY